MTGKQGQSQGCNVRDWPELRGVAFNTHGEAGRGTVVKSGADSPTEASLRLFPLDGHMSPREQATLRQPFRAVCTSIIRTTVTRPSRHFKARGSCLSLPLQECAHHLLKSLVTSQEWAGDPPLQRLAVLIQAKVELLTAHILLIENRADAQ